MMDKFAKSHIENGYVVCSPTGALFLTDKELQQPVYLSDSADLSEYDSCETAIVEIPDLVGGGYGVECAVIRNQYCENPFVESDFYQPANQPFISYRFAR